MVNKLKILELFGGIGACSNALKRLNIPFEIVDYVEIDKYAVKSYNAIYGTNFEPQDITTWDKDVEVDLIMHGSPCQDFSLAGKQLGGDKDSGTRSSLMYETLRIVGKLKPKYVIWENVKNILSQKHIHNFNAYLGAMEELGYVNHYQVLNAKDYGVPQNRERVFTISIRDDSYGGNTIGNPDDTYEEDYIANYFSFPPKQELKLRLKDMLEDEVDEKYYLSEKMIKYISASGTANFRNSDCKINLDIARALTTVQDKRAGITNYLSDNLPSNFDLIQIGQMYGTKKEPNPQAGRIYDSEGLSPTVDSCSGGNRMPKVLIKNATKQGYSEAYDGDSVNLEQPNSKTRRGRVGKQVSQTLTTSCNQGVIIGSTQKHTAISYDGIVPTLTSAMGQGGGHVPMHNYGLRIRKLTPKECWRLMGFQDEDFEKAERVNSNTQLYKQAGNSIVVNVLMAILTNLLIPGQATLQDKQLSIFDKEVIR